MNMSPELANNQSESPGLVIKGGDSCLDGRGFESQYRMLYGHFYIYLL